ncbi:MAG TPA: hypothetical protein VH481_07545 [Nitrososphaeraceae archaeon]|jgi:hypothetical protein
MGADVKGLYDFQKHLRDLASSADPNTFNEWAKRIGRTAKEICNDPDCKRIKLIKSEYGKVKFQFADKEAVDCVIQAIKTYLNSMPRTQQVIFKGFTTELEKIKIQF